MAYLPYTTNKINELYYNNINYLSSDGIEYYTNSKKTANSYLFSITLCLYYNKISKFCINLCTSTNGKKFLYIKSDKYEIFNKVRCSLFSKTINNHVARRDSGCITYLRDDDNELIINTIFFIGSSLSIKVNDIIKEEIMVRPSLVQLLIIYDKKNRILDNFSIPINIDNIPSDYRRTICYINSQDDLIYFIIYRIGMLCVKNNINYLRKLSKRGLIECGNNFIDINKSIRYTISNVELTNLYYLVNYINFTDKQDNCILINKGFINENDIVVSKMSYMDEEYKQKLKRINSASSLVKLLINNYTTIKFIDYSFSKTKNVIVIVNKNYYYLKHLRSDEFSFEYDSNKCGMFTLKKVQCTKNRLKNSFYCGGHKSNEDIPLLKNEEIEKFNKITSNGKIKITIPLYCQDIDNQNLILTIDNPKLGLTIDNPKLGLNFYD